jgi:GGDEF domain-containing protein
VERYGGEEFLFILENASLAAAKSIAGWARLFAAQPHRELIARCRWW